MKKVHKNSEYTTKCTFIGNGKYGCRIFRNDKIVVEGIAEGRMQVGGVFRDMFRTIDKCGGDEFTHASRYRKFSERNKPLYISAIHYWGGRDRYRREK